MVIELNPIHVKKDIVRHATTTSGQENLICFMIYDKYWNNSAALND